MSCNWRGANYRNGKVLNALPNAQEIKAEKILEINTNHEVFSALKKAYENDKKTKIIYWCFI